MIRLISQRYSFAPLAILIDRMNTRDDYFEITGQRRLYYRHYYYFSTIAQIGELDGA